jgi:hypothetical protein
VWKGKHKPPKGGNRCELKAMKNWFSLKRLNTAKISTQQKQLERKSFRNVKPQVAATDLGTSPLLRQLGEGLLKLLLGSVGLLLAYSGYLLAPHLRELLYGHFGRPESRLERGWSQLKDWLTASVETGAVKNPGGAAPEAPAGGEGLSKELKESWRRKTAGWRKPWEGT